MKVIVALTAMLGLVCSQGDWELETTGLCLPDKSTSCPTRLQKYGVCCRIKNVPT